MATLTREFWYKLRKKLQGIALGVTEVPVRIIEIPRAEGELGYTSSGNTIHLAYDHPVMDPLTVEHHVAFVQGVFTHELMHRIATPFAEFERMLNGMPIEEAKIFAQIFNVIEDPAIEYQAPMYIGGHLLKCLSYSIMTLYKETEPMRKKARPFSQFMTALIMYGDGGAVKGKFHSQKARNIFYKCLPLVDEAIVTRDGKRRLKLAYDVFLLSKPLWKKDLEDMEKMRQLLEELSKLMRSSGKGTSGTSGGSPLDLDPDEDAAGSSSEKKSRRRKITYRKISKEEMEEMLKGASSGDEGEEEPGPDDDIEILYTEEPCEIPKKEKEEKGKGSGKTVLSVPNEPDSKSGEDPEEKTPAGASGSGEEKEKSDEDSESKTKKRRKPSSEGADGPEAAKSRTGGSGDDGEENGAESSERGDSGSKPDEDSGEKDGKAGSRGADAPETGKTSKRDSGDETRETADESDSEASEKRPAGGTMEGGVAPDYDKEEEIAEEEYELSDEDLNRIHETIEAISEENDIEKAESDACYAEPLDIPEMDCSYRGARCLNKRIKCSNPEALESRYNELITKLMNGIVFLENQLKRLIRNCVADREYRNTGRLNIKRLNSGRMTCRVFDRKLDPANMGDICVEIVVDESGSMSSGGNWRLAMQCVIALAEVFSRLHIPTKVIGFTADEKHGGITYDVIHHHYMHWLNTKNERMNLMSITARSNNFDGYSIRYAAKMIAKRKEAHKIMIIISDGAPACNYYYRQNGIADTKDAILEATKVADVIGVGVGNSSTKTLHAMYGNDFLHVQNANQLLSKIGAAIQNKMKRWND